MFGGVLKEKKFFDPKGGVLRGLKLAKEILMKILFCKKKNIKKKNL